MATDLEQVHFRFRTDSDATDATPTWGADEDANYYPGVSPFRLRMGLANVADASSGSLALYLQKNAGSYAAITTASTGGVKSYDASSDADDTPIRIPRLSMSVDWQLAGAAIDLDFANNRIYPTGAFTDFLSCSRASAGYAKNSSGTWVEFSSDALRITDLGLLIEEARTNYLLNSATPATQETASLGTGDYTLWVEGSGSAIASNGTGTITGAESATDGSPSTFTVTVSGTINVTVTGSLDRFQLENGTKATSYIPTTGASAARAGDHVSLIGSLNSLMTSLPLSIVCDLTCSAAPVPNWIFVGDSTVNAAFLYAGQDNELSSYLASTANVRSFVGSGALFTTGVKVGIALATGARSITGKGLSPATDASAQAGTSGNVDLGSYNGATWFMSGRMRRITFWDSKISDANLQTFTA